MSKSTENYKRLNTYFYDYHALKISLETSKIKLKCDEDELEFEKEFVKCEEEIKRLTTIIDRRKQIIFMQQEMLNEMDRVLSNFPSELKGLEYAVYYLTVVENKSTVECAEELAYSKDYIREIRSTLITKFSEYRNKLA